MSETGKYKYYSTQRPLGINTFPKQNGIYFENYDEKTYIEEIDREAWGEINYTEPLTKEQELQYELLPSPQNQIREVTHGEEKEIQKIAQDIFYFYDQSDEMETENVNEIYDKLLNGEIEKYVKDLTDYRESFRGELSPNELIQIYDIVHRLGRISNESQLDQNIISMPIAIESTEDYSDYFFHANMDNTEGKEKENYYRVVFVNDYGYCQPLTDYYYTTKEEAIQQFENIEGLQFIPYDDLIKSTENNSTRTQELREKYNADIKRYTDAMQLVGWECRLSQGQHTFWYKDDNENLFDDEQNEIEEIDFDDFSSLQSYLEDFIITNPDIEKKFNSLVFGARKAELIDLAKELDKAAYQYMAYEYWDKIGYGDRARERNVDNIMDNLDKGNAEPYLKQLSEMIENNENTEDIKSYKLLEERIKNFVDGKLQDLETEQGTKSKSIFSIKMQDEETCFENTSGLDAEALRKAYSECEKPFVEMAKYGTPISIADFAAIQQGEHLDFSITFDEDKNEITISDGDKFEYMNLRETLDPKEEKKEDIQEKENLTPKDELMQKLKDGIKQTLDSENFADWCKKQGRLFLNNYSLTNALLTYIQKPEASYVCGYEAWKNFGRQVKKGATGIKIFAPVFAKEYGGKGSLLASIKKSCNQQFKKDPQLEYATYRLGQSKLSFNMYKNGLFDVKINDEVKMPHITSDEMRKFIDQAVIGKVPTYYNAITVFDVSDTTSEVEYLWVNKDACKKEEIVPDENGNPIKNKRGQIKIFNTEERKNRFNVDIDMVLKEQDTDKMQMLYETLQKISNDKGIPMSEVDPAKDETLAGGSLGYYRHATPAFPKGNIVISSDLSLTDKVAVTFHEMAHSDMHRDLDKLKAEMGNDVDKITRQMKEVQAEAVAYMTASTFGIETEHKSFAYIANWSDGRELKALENSLNVIYKESCKMLQEIQSELDAKGYTMGFEPKDKTPMDKEQKSQIVIEYKDFILNNNRENESIQKSALEDLKSLDNEEQQAIVKEQIVLTRKIEEKLTSLNTKTEQFEKSEDKQEQVKLQYQMKAERDQIKTLQNKINDLSLERIETVKEQVKQNKADMKQMYAENPFKAMEQLKKDFSQMKDLTDTDMKYLASSKFISRNYSQYLGSDNERFVNLAMKQLENFKDVLSKNKTAVEISFCEQWSDKPIFENGTLAHPKEANKIFSDAEKQIRDFKEQAEKKGEYYPYAKCEFSVYSYTGDNKLSVLNTRIDIGDGEQKDLTDHMKQICSKGKEKQEILDNYVKSTRERSNIQILVPEQEQKSVIEEISNQRDNASTYSMSEWKDSMQDKAEFKEERPEKETEQNRENEKE